MQKICPVTGRTFEVTPEEMALRKKLGIEGEPEFHPVFRFMQLGAFWQHWNLFKRSCDRTGKSIISVFSEDCPYPVWHKDEWIKHADPPQAEVEVGKPFFPQMWELFRRCPIPHNVGVNNQNCEYTDDWWNSKNCYLCHSGVSDEDLRYCYRAFRVKNCMYGAFSFDSEWCLDLTYSHNCFRVLYSFNCWQCSDSAFLYDCRNCQHCFLCSNLRNKQYCIKNKQYNREEYESMMKEWDLCSNRQYMGAKQEWESMMHERAWHRSLFIDRSEQSTGNFIDHSKNARNCYFVNDVEDSMNILRTSETKDTLDCVSPAVNVQLAYYSCTVQDNSYDCKFCYNVIQCKFTEYCAHCFQCQHCFACCGVVGKKYCIFNKQYTSEEYEKKKAEFIASMKATDEYGKFFPNSFAANPYDESLSGFYWPLDSETAIRFGFRLSNRRQQKPEGALDPSLIPDSSEAVDPTLSTSVFWDEEAGHSFRIDPADIKFCTELGAPLPRSYYSRRMQDNFRLIPFDGSLRPSSCGKCQRETMTSWSVEYDGRVLCEECYLKEVY
ncbi:MAG: hypothetical protein PHZ00_08005 [Candidatus Peribacteraceae bacterium]|nr:hypothetical protein [Candidatus Peribacteraceae bacterium]